MWCLLFDLAGQSFEIRVAPDRVCPRRWPPPSRLEFNNEAPLRHFHIIVPEEILNADQRRCLLLIQFVASRFNRSIRQKPVILRRGRRSTLVRTTPSQAKTWCQVRPGGRGGRAAGRFRSVHPQSLAKIGVFRTQLFGQEPAEPLVLPFELNEICKLVSVRCGRGALHGFLLHRLCGAFPLIVGLLRNTGALDGVLKAPLPFADLSFDLLELRGSFLFASGAWWPPPSICLEPAPQQPSRASATAAS